MGIENQRFSRRAILKKAVELGTPFIAAVTAVVVTACQRSDNERIERAVNATLTATSKKDGTPTLTGLGDVIKKMTESPAPPIRTVPNTATPKAAEPAKPAPTPEPAKPPEGWKLFRSSNFPYEMYYPSEWQIPARAEYLVPELVNKRPANADIVAVIDKNTGNGNIWIYREQLDKKIDLDAYIKDRVKNIERAISLPNGVKITNKMISGQEGRVISWQEKEYQAFSAVFVKDNQLWTISLILLGSQPSIAKQLTEFQTMLDSFTLLPQSAKPAEVEKPAEKPKSVEKQKVQSVAERLKKLKPEELQRALLTNPFSKENLPKDFVVESGPTPDFPVFVRLLSVYGLIDIDKLAMPFKPIGTVSFGLKNEEKFYAVSYTVFPDGNAAKGAFDSISSQPDTRSIKDFDTPALLNTTRMDITKSMAGGIEAVLTISSGYTGIECIILLNNLLINTGSIMPFVFQPRTENLKTQEAIDKAKTAQEKQIEQDILKLMTIQESAIIPVVKSGIGHLQKITS